MSRSPTEIADKLLAAGVITKEKYQGAIHHYNQYGGEIAEALLEVQALDEESLLKSLAQMYRTRYVTSEKLRLADIPKNVLEKIPGDLAAQKNIFPILYDEASRQLSIVTFAPNDLEVEQQVKISSGAGKVRAFLARPQAIKACISKFYKGDIHAFAMLDKESFQAFHSMMDVYERNLLDEASMATALAGSSGHSERVISAEEMERGADAATAPAATGGLQLTTMVEMLRVMVSLLESNRGELAGHSVLTASHAERMSQRIGLSENETGEVTISALIHDLGKGSPYHLTPFNVAEWDGHRTAAEKRLENPIRLFDSVNLPASAFTALRHMYERFDGRGIPDGIRAKDIPLGARILAICDTFADLTANPRNPYRRVLSTEEGIEAINRGKGKIFDPNLVDLFKVVVAGDDLKRQLLTGAQSLMIVDPDAEQCAILDLQLTSRGFRVRTARTADAAIRELLQQPVDLVVSEVELEPFDGFEMKQRLNESEKTKGLPLIYFTSRAGSTDVEKGFKLGAQDYLVKPSAVDVLVAKVNKTLEQAGRTTMVGGVSGSLKEMSLPDLVQILSHGRKNGQLRLAMGNQRGEIHFVNGDIYNALFGNLRGEEAFFAMLRFKEGTFALNPEFQADARVIEMTSEMLLLEGLRRYDEDNK